MTYANSDDDDLYDDDNDEVQPDPRQVTLDRKQIRSLERDAKQARGLADENTKLQRELAFTKAGINSDDPKLAYFAKGYDGEMTAEAIRQAAETAGFLASPEATNAEQDEMAALDRVSQASAGTAARSKDEDRVAALKQAGTQSRDAVLAEIARQGGTVLV